MSTPSWTDLEALFHDALACAPAERAAFLAERCAGHPELQTQLEALLRGDPQTPRPAALAGRLVRVLAELHLVSLDPDSRTLTVPVAERTALERSEAFRAYQQRLENGRRWLRVEKAKAAHAAKPLVVPHGLVQRLEKDMPARKTGGRFPIGKELLPPQSIVLRVPGAKRARRQPAHSGAAAASAAPAPAPAPPQQLPQHE